MSTENIASIYIEAVLSTRKLKEDIKALEKSKISIDVDVDDKELTALNKHLDKKVSHYAQVRNEFKNNPLEVLVNDSQLTQLNELLEKTKSGAKIQIEFTQNPGTEFVQSFEKELSKVSEVLKAPFASIATGFFENIGGTFGRQVSQGIAKNLQQNLGFNLNDFTNQTLNKVVKNSQTSGSGSTSSSNSSQNNNQRTTNNKQTQNTSNNSSYSYAASAIPNPAQEQADVIEAIKKAQKINKIIQDVLNKNITGTVNHSLGLVIEELEKSQTKAQAAPQKPQTPTVLNIPLRLPTVEKEKEEILKSATKVQKVNNAVQEAVSKNVAKAIDKSLELIKLEIVKPDANINIAKNQFANITSRLSEAYKSLKVEMEKGNLEIAKYYATSINESATRARAEIEKIQANLKASGVSNQFGSELATLVGSTKGTIEARYAKPSRQKLEQINNAEKVGEFVDVGKQVIAGTIQGLKSNSTLVKESNEVAFTILNAMRKTLGIQSPSKKAQEIMAFVIEGLIAGSKSGLGSVQNASNEVSKVLLQGIIKATDGSLYKEAKNQIFNLDAALASGQAKIYPTVKKFFNSVDAAMSQGNIYPAFKNVLSRADSALSSNNSKSAQVLYNKLLNASVVANAVSNVVPPNNLITNPNTVIQPGLGANSSVQTQVLVNANSRLNTALNSAYISMTNLLGNTTNIISNTTQKIQNAAQSNTVLASNQNIKFKPNTQNTVQKAAFGTVEFFDAMYDDFANQFIGHANKSFGKGKGRAIAREAGAMAFSMAGFMAPLQTAMGLFTPLLSQALPLVMTGGLLNNLLSPVVNKVVSSLRITSPIQERLNVLGGGQQGGQAEMSYLQGVGQKYNTSVQAGSDAYSKLAFAAKGTKLEGEGVRELYEGIAASIRTMNLGTGESSLIFQAYTQILAKGKLSMEELRQQLGEKFPQAMQIFAKAMGVSVPELQSLIGKGAILSEDILPKVARVLKSEFGDTGKLGDSFVSSMVKMENAAFNLNLNLSNTFGGLVAQVYGLGSGLLEAFNANFGAISKLAGALVVGMTAQVAIGFQTMMAIPAVSTHLNNLQNFFFSTLKKTTSMLFPFMVGSFIDVFDDFFGVQNSVFDNMAKGTTQAFTAIFGILDSAKSNITSSGLFDATFNQQNLGMIEAISTGLGNFFKIIPSGAVEMLALVMMFEQVKVLGAMFIAPQWEMFSKAVGQIGFAFKNAALNSTNFKDTLKTVLPIATESLKGLLAASKEIFVAFAVMSLARSDFGNPIADSFNKAANKIVGNIGEIDKALQGLKTSGEKLGKTIEESVKLPSKGLELNPGKVLGLSDDSFKSDDLFRSFNSGKPESLSDSERKVAKARKDQADSLGIGDYFSENDKYATLAQDQLLNNAKAIDTFRKSLATELGKNKLTPETVKDFATQPGVNKALIEVQEIDKKIKELSDKRVDISLINTSESKVQLREIDGQIKGLVKQRQPKSKIFDEIFGNIEDTKKQLDDATKSIEGSDLPNKAKKALISMLEPQKKAIDETVEYLKNAGIYKLAKPLEEIWTSVVARLSDAELAFDRLKDKTKIIGLQEQAAIFNTAQTPGSQRFALGRQNISSLQNDQNALRIQAAFREKALRDLLSISGVETNEVRRNEVTKLREQVNKDKIALAESQLSIAKAKADLLQQLKDQTKQVNEYYQGITRQVQEANLEFQKQINNIKSNNAATRIRQAIGDSEDSFLNTFVENLIGQIESIKEVSNSKLDLQTKNLQSSFQLEDSFKTGLELKKALPDIPAIPVELDLSQVASDENVQNLNAEFGQTNELIGQLNQGSSALDSLIQQNQGSASTLVEEFQKTLEASDKTSETITSNIQATSEWQNSLSLITSESSNIFDKFNGMFGILNQISSTTASWLQQLSAGAGVLGNLASNFAQTGFGQGLTTIGNAIMGGGSSSGFVSPIKGKTIDELLKYTPSQAQGFYGKRDGGARQHSKVDFDSRVGAGQGAEILASISGMAKFRQITGNSGGVDISGKDSKGNDITVVYNHLALPELKQFFGGSKTKQVNAGQRLSTVTMDSLSSGAHLDFGIKVNGAYVDPQKWMASEGKALASMQKQIQNGAQVKSPSVTSAQGGISQGGNKLTQAEYNKLTPLGKKLYQYQQDPRILAFGDVVARAEGTDFRSNSKNFGYSMMIGGEHDTDFSRHPFAGNSGSRIRPPRHNSTASGRYQMMDFNYSKTQAARQFGKGAQSDLAAIFQGENPGSMSPAVQDLYFIASLQSRGILDEVLSGNFQGALSNPNIAKHYASLQSGSKKSAYGGQGTPEGQLKNTIPFAQQRLQARLQNRSNQVMTPAQMQGTVNQGMLLQQGSINQGMMVNQQQAEADQKRIQQTLLKNQENQLNNLRKNLESNQSLQLSTNRRTQDLRLSIDPNKDFKQQLQEAIIKLKREYDDIELELSKKSEEIKRSLEKSKNLLASGEVTGKNREVLQDKIASDEATLSIVSKNLNDTRKLRNEALAKLAESMNFEETQRQNKIDFENTGLSLDNLRAKLEALKAVQSTNPLSAEVLNIPDVERMIQLKDEELNLNKQLVDLDTRRFKKELTDAQFNTQAEQLKKNSIQKRDNIQLTYELAKAEQALKLSAVDLEIRSKGLELDFAVKQEQIKSVQLSKKYNPLADPDNKELTLGNELQIQQLALETEKSIQSIKEFARSMGLSKEATDSLINSVLELNDIKLDNITKEFNDSLGESKIKQLEDVNSRENRIADFNNNRTFALEQMKIDRSKTLGGNEFAANARSRTLGKTQEMIRYEKEKREVEIEVLRMRQSGINVDDSWLSKTREDMEAIHNLNLENINTQFKTFGDTLNEIGNQSIKGLSNGLTDLIMGTKSLNNVLDDFFGNILNQVINTGLQSLLGGLFGGGGGGGFLGGIFGGLFYEGGTVPNYAKGKPPKNISDAMRKEAMQSGRKPQLAVVHENELIIPASRAEKLSSLGLTPEMLLGKVSNYADGGVVGRAAQGVPTTSSNSQAQTINVEYTKINDVEYVTLDQFQQGIKTAIEQGGSLGEKRVQSKMANSVAFRGSVGMR